MQIPWARTRQSVVFLSILVFAGMSARAQKLDGIWINRDPEEGGFTRMEVQGTVIHLFGTRSGGPPDWGVIPMQSEANGTRLHGIFRDKDSVREIRVELNKDRKVKLLVRTHFVDQSRRQDYERESQFRPGF